MTSKIVTSRRKKKKEEKEAVQYEGNRHSYSEFCSHLCKRHFGNISTLQSLHNNSVSKNIFKKQLGQSCRHEVHGSSTCNTPKPKQPKCSTIGN